MSVGARIKNIRVQQGLTQAELGRRCGMKDSAIRRYESGRGNPTEKTLRRIADALGVAIESLISERVEMIPDRAWVTVPDAPYSENYSYEIDAVDKEAFEATIQLLGGEKILTYTVENRINAALHRLSAKGLLVAVERLEELTKIPEYCQEDPQDK